MSERCAWCGDDIQMIGYHDSEWGRPTSDRRVLFEKICLEGFQAGLSWATILRKRDNFRAAFHQFEAERVAEMGARDVERLLQDAGIVRHRAKIESVINNAQRLQELESEWGSLGAYVWSFEPAPDQRPAHLNPEVLAALNTDAASRALSKDLKKRGFSFVGPTTLYAFMQSSGIVNDHLETCPQRSEVETLRGAFERPTKS